MIRCNPCEGTGFKNGEQFPPGVIDLDFNEKLEWLLERNEQIDSIDCSCHISAPCQKCELLHDITVCDCCGDGDGWYGTPGEHYNSEDPVGRNGPYASNGGLCKCH